MAAEAVEQESFTSIGRWDSIRLCTDMMALSRGDAAAETVDGAVLATAPVPEGRLIQVDEVSSRMSTYSGNGDEADTPRPMVRIVCRDPRIHDAVSVARRLDPETREKSIRVWVLRVASPDGATLDYRFRARLLGVASYEVDAERVVNVHVRALDMRPTVTEPRAGPPRPSLRAGPPGPNPAG